LGALVDVVEYRESRSTHSLEIRRDLLPAYLRNNQRAGLDRCYHYRSPDGHGYYAIGIGYDELTGPSVNKDTLIARANAIATQNKVTLQQDPENHRMLFSLTSTDPGSYFYVSIVHRAINELTAWAKPHG
jgi:hypothetical protein